MPHHGKIKRIVVAIILLAIATPSLARAQLITARGQKIQHVANGVASDDAATVGQLGGGGGGGASGITQLTGPITAGPGSGSQASAVTANALTNAMLAQMVTLTLKGNNTGGTANALDLTVAQVNTMLGVGVLANPLSQFASTTSALLAGVISDETGSGPLVFATSPTLTTPTLGVASATSINKLTLTQPATGSTLTLSDGVTLTVPSTLNTSTLAPLASPTFTGTVVLPAVTLGGAFAAGNNAFTAVKLISFNSEINNGNKTGASQNIGDFTAGARQKITLTGNVSSSTWTVASTVTDWRLKVCQDATGSRTITWPTSPAITWVGGTAPTLTTTASACDLIGFYYDGAIVWGQLPGSGGGAGVTAGTGDVTFSGTGSVATTNVNAPDGFTHAGKIINTEIAAPSTPAASKVATWVDSTDARFHDKNPAGTIATTVVADNGAANNYISAISAAGVITKSQPAFTNISGTAAIAQGGTAATTAVAGGDALSVKGADIASATTTDLSTATGQYVHITGTTTITAFGTMAAGVKRQIEYTGALTLTHNATSLILLIGANRTTAAGDIEGLISEGSGNWRETSYHTAGAVGLVASKNLSDVTTPATAIANIGGLPLAGGTMSGAIAMGAQNLLNVGTTTRKTRIDDGNSSTAQTIDFSTGNDHKSTLTANTTYTFTAPSGTNPIASLSLEIVQGGAGAFTVTWPSTVLWQNSTPPTIAGATGVKHLILCRYDGNGPTYDCSADLNRGASGGSIAKQLVRAPQYLTSGTSFTPAAGTTLMVVRVWAAGGGGGGVVAAGATTVAVAGGGAAGGYLEWSTTTIPGTCTYAIGTAGTGGANTGANGSAGGNTTFSDGTTTVTANGGPGGIGDATASAALQVINGGAPPAISTNGTVNGSGAPGEYGISIVPASGIAQSGSGGSSLWGGAGIGKNDTGGAGNAATAPGSGGSGALSVSSSAAAVGGAGFAGLIVVTEYQ